MAQVKFAKNVQPIRAGKGVWVRWGGYDGETIIAAVRSETKPDGDEWAPYFPASRVMGDSYSYYEGRSEWEQAANAAMASEANSNFCRGQSR
jgi:hypothetical protein